MCFAIEPFCLRFFNWLKKVLLFVSWSFAIISSITFDQVTSGLLEKNHRYHTNWLGSKYKVAMSTFCMCCTLWRSKYCSICSIHVTGSLLSNFLISIFGIWWVFNPMRVYEIMINIFFVIIMSFLFLEIILWGIGVSVIISSITFYFHTQIYIFYFSEGNSSVHGTIFKETNVYPSNL